MKIAAATDSNSGITQDQAKQLGVHVLPMPFIIDGQMYYEGVDLTHEEFSDGWRRERILPPLSRPLVR